MMKWAGLLALGLVLGFGLGACADGAGPAGSVDFNYTMSSDELRAAADAAGLTVAAESDHAALLDALGAALGCDCPATACGVSTCGTTCGNCEGAACFDGACLVAEGGEFYGFNPFSHATNARSIGGATKVGYTAVDGLKIATEPPFAKLKIEMVREKFTGGAGTYDLANSSGPDCALCVTGYQNCNEIDCFNKFKVESGTLILTSDGAPGDRLTGYITDATLVEYDKGKPVEKPTKKNAKHWYIGHYAFDQAVPEIAIAEGTCVDEGTGTDLFNNIADFKLQNCEGEWVNLHSRCGKVSAFWFVLTAGWCGACEAWVPKVRDQYNDEKDRGLDIAIIVGEDVSGAAPTLAYCAKYASDKGLDPRQVFIDNDGQAWGTTLKFVNNYASGNFGIPWNAVFDGVSMEYRFSDTAGAESRDAVLQSLYQAFEAN